jgi:hypothetical protein
MAYGATPSTTCHTLHFSEKTPVGKKVTFCDSNQHLFGVFQYLDRNTSKTMQWEIKAELNGCPNPSGVFAEVGHLQTWLEADRSSARRRAAT